ncbi:hypothetical protein HMPREF9607_01551 [Cutibacterium modestum HL044PA1]|uniref:Uncharacterized protein n=1 Tax=Cutibacterium modestum HL044PA1 TaxID=765109 RepID=A0ABP2K839_9ACTN|nr:hypothetical protein HMPREF9607_01551 [Cutibacterium modestum HL044PA1]
MRHRRHGKAGHSPTSKVRHEAGLPIDLRPVHDDHTANVILTHPDGQGAGVVDSHDEDERDRRLAAKSAKASMGAPQRRRRDHSLSAKLLGVVESIKVRWFVTNSCRS